MSGKRRPPRAVLPVLAWDTVWKLVAIRRAVRLKKYRWIPVLAFSSTGGLVPIAFLLKNRGAGGRGLEPEAEAGDTLAEAV